MTFFVWKSFKTNCTCFKYIQT